MNRYDPIQTTENVIDWDKDPFIKYQDLFKDTIDWAKDPMSHPTNQNKYFYSDGKTYYEQICKMLKLMSAFKESFAYIYENEEELHSAWENFVDNLTASAEYGEEVGVTLTWTEDSVNFDFTIPGGADGVGIQSIVFNQDYSMTITLTDGTVYNSPSLRGPQGETGATGAQGPQGPQGEGLEILDVYTTLADLQTEHPTGSAGDAYQVGTSPNFTLYIWSTSQQAWVPAGALTSPDATTTTPLMDGTASVGSENAYARGDHRHPTDTSRASASDLTTVSENLLELAGDVSDIADGLGAVQTEIEDLSDIVQVSQSLIDQEFLYRETPADHNTIARLDSIKGNTISFNQLIQNGNFASVSVWDNNVATYSVMNNIASISYNGAVTGIYKRFTYIANHKYYECADIKADCEVMFGRSGLDIYTDVNNWHKMAHITQTTSTLERDFVIYSNQGVTGTGTIQAKNVMRIDLTAIGIDSFTTPAQVEAWLLAKLGPLDYFSYDPGSLISFKGTGLKTVGKNLIENVVQGGLNQRGIVSEASNRISTNAFDISLFENIVFSGTGPKILQAYVLFFGGYPDGTIEYIANSGWVTFETSIAISSEWKYAMAMVRWSDNSDITPNDVSNIQVENGTTPTSYEPYTSNTLPLPVSDYFPDGEMSVISIHDDLNQNQAIKRTVAINLGNLNYTYQDVNNQFYSDIISNIPNNAEMNINVLCGKYITKVANHSELSTPHIRGFYSQRLYIVDDNYANDASALKSSLSNVYAIFPLATPLENYGVVDLGNIDWYYDSTTLRFYTVDAISNIKKPSSDNSLPNAISSIYLPETGNDSYSSQNNMKFAIGQNSKIYIRNTTYTDPSAFKTAMSGVYLLYDKSTPEIIDLDLTYPTEKGGTEQLLPVNTSTPVTTPLLADMTYMSTDEAIMYLCDLLDTIDQGLDTIIDTLDTFIDTLNTTLTDMSGYVLYTYTSTDTNQGLTTQQLDYSILNKCNYVEIFYTEYLNGNIQKSSGKLAFKMLNSTEGDVAMNTNISQMQIGQTSVRTIGWNSSGSMTISRCQTTYDDNTQEYTDNKMIVRKIVAYNINETTSN